MLVVRKAKNKEKVENFIIINMIQCTRLILWLSPSVQMSHTAGADWYHIFFSLFHKVELFLVLIIIKLMFKKKLCLITPTPLPNPVFQLLLLRWVRTAWWVWSVKRIVNCWVHNSQQSFVSFNSQKFVWGQPQGNFYFYVILCKLTWKNLRQSFDFVMNLLIKRLQMDDELKSQSL